MIVKNLINKKFTRLYVKRLHPKRKNQKKQWECLCECGTLLLVDTNSLTSGHTKSCGCLKEDLLLKRTIRHGKCGTPTYTTWKNIIKRCRKPEKDSISIRKNKKYYFDRNITVCKEWENFETFLADMGDRPKGKYSLDRINNNLGYSKDNCRWATHTQQMRNTRANKFIEYKGIKKCLSEWADELKINPTILCKRLLRGWSDERTITTPVKK